MRKKMYAILAIGLFVPGIAKAHCPLCTVGAGALAVGAAYLGVSTYVVGIFLGACAFALGILTSKVVKKKYVRYQKQIIILLVFLSTIIPVMPLIAHYTSINIYWFGEYGSLLNRTYMINRMIIGSVIGGITMYLSPSISKKVSQRRGKQLFPYQGMVITFGLLLIVSLIAQFII